MLEQSHNEPVIGGGGHRTGVGRSAWSSRVRRRDLAVLMAGSSDASRGTDRQLSGQTRKIHWSGGGRALEQLALGGADPTQDGWIRARTSLARRAGGSGRTSGGTGRGRHGGGGSNANGRSNTVGARRLAGRWWRRAQERRGRWRLLCRRERRPNPSLIPC
jgi:hypothetical protein